MARSRGGRGVNPKSRTLSRVDSISSRVETACGVGGKTPCDEGGVVFKGVGGRSQDRMEEGVNQKAEYRAAWLDIGTRKKRLGECMGGPYRMRYIQWPKVWERVNRDIAWRRGNCP